MGELFPRSERRRGELVLELSELWGRDKPKGASLSLHRGEVLGIAGLMGAGRTELVRAVFGLDEVESGSVRVGSFSGPARPADWLEHGMGLLSEDRQGEGVLLDRSITENVTLSRLDRWLRPERLARASRELVEELGIVCRSTEQRLSTLSGGNQQKVAFARLLHHELDVLLLDEPTRGIDVASKAQIYRWIDRLAHEGKAVLLVSSDLQEILGLSDRIAVMRRGVLGEPQASEDLDEAGLLREAVS